MEKNFGNILLNLIAAPIKNYKKYRSLYKFDDRDDAQTSASDIVWALRDISFNIKEGDVCGIVGANGAGKSTLLKILCRVTPPTSGRACITGRVSSLLEVGTGFHPELTGRENVYLNGTVLGMKKSEVDRKFDEIVDFSGVEKFIDTPVKRYSSGMTVRLAFSVAAHLEPEILIVDEVLAVGDASFQRKCISKMKRSSESGRTILFVSHNLGAIQNLCTKAIWIDNGRLKDMGDVNSTIKAYLNSFKNDSANDGAGWRRFGNGKARIKDIRLFSDSRNECSVFGMGETLIIEFDVDFFESFASVDLALEVKRSDIGITILHLVNQDCGYEIRHINKGRKTFRTIIPDFMLYPNSYTISIWVGTENSKVTLDYAIDAKDFSMTQTGVTMRTTNLSIHKEAIFFAPSKWEAI
jgi:lipopolysaccharide transport system ATP-binding protein